MKPSRDRARPGATYQRLRRLNDSPPGALAGEKSRVDERTAAFFCGDSLEERFARALARRRAVPVKELFESCEFFARIRKRLRAPRVADLCAGHGLVGLLFALFERRVERVTLLDRRVPASFEKVLAAAVEVGPWVADKIEYCEGRLAQAGELLAPGTSIAAAHACGERSDRCVDLALELRAAIGLLPCCYSKALCEAPPALLQALGPELAADVHRTYRLESAGWSVRWDELPAGITPMARVLSATPPGN